MVSRLLVPLTALLVLLAPAVSGAQFKPRVFNGDPAADGTHPWTVALVTAGRDASDGQVCAGTLIQPDRVLTAAHCTVATAPAEIDVFAGDVNLAPQRLPGDHRYHRVEAIALHPDAEAEANPPRSDLSLLKLAVPVDGASTLALGPDVPPAVGLAANVAGWGETGGPRGDRLREGIVALRSQENCASAWSLGDPAQLDDVICALGDAGGGRVIDTCDGDSGGPLTTLGTEPADGTTAGWSLLGVTSFGSEGCDDPDMPGAYARLDTKRMRDFALATVPTVQPSPKAGSPLLTGQAEIGATITCAPGTQTWDREGVTTSALVRSDNGASTSLKTHARAVEGPASYTIGASDAGRRFLCELQGRLPGGGGYGVVTAEFGRVPVPLQDATSVTEPAPVPPLGGSSPPAPTAISPPPPADLAAPRTTLIQRACRRRRCTFTVRTSDPLPSVGVSTVYAVLERIVRRRCGVRLCNRVRRTVLRSARLDATSFRIRTAKLARSRHTLVVAAVDRAGHVQRVPKRVRFVVR